MPSPASALLGVEARHYIEAARHETNAKKRRSLADTAFLLAQLAESYDHTGALSHKIIALLDGKVRLLAESIAHGDTLKLRWTKTTTAVPTALDRSTTEQNPRAPLVQLEQQENPPQNDRPHPPGRSLSLFGWLVIGVGSLVLLAALTLVDGISENRSFVNSARASCLANRDWGMWDNDASRDPSETLTDRCERYAMSAAPRCVEKKRGTYTGSIPLQEWCVAYASLQTVLNDDRTGVGDKIQRV
jgi:hypothetical protein